MEVEGYGEKKGSTMAHAHRHDDGGHSGHDHAAGANSRSLTIALALTGTFLVAEVVVAWLFNRLAVFCVAALVFSDAAAIAIALAAIRIPGLLGLERRLLPNS